MALRMSGTYLPDTTTTTLEIVWNVVDQLGGLQFTIVTPEMSLSMLRVFSPYLKLLHQDTMQHKQLLGFDLQRPSKLWHAEPSESIRVPYVPTLLDPLQAIAT